LGWRHFLAGEARLDDPVAVAGGLVGLHSSDPASVFISAAARYRDPNRAIPSLERALYDDRSLVRTLGMRRTMFVVPTDMVAVVQAGCTDALVAPQRRRLVQMIEASGTADGKDAADWLREVEDKTVAALERLGEATGAELSKAVPELRRQVVYAEGKKWGGPAAITTRVLFLLSTEQRVVRGRPKGSWTSSLYRWSPMAAWLPAGLPKLAAAEARAELLRRWLFAFGPATTEDIKWWTGWTVGQTKAAVVDVRAVEVRLDTGTGWLLPDDDAPVAPPGPWVALLPGLDPTTMGWKDRNWYLGDHSAALFDRNGNAGPTVWVDGRVVGGWAQRRTGEVVFEMTSEVRRKEAAAVDAAATRLREWLGEVRVTPRFPTPLQKELTA
jgi:hypothetical protein